MIIQDDDFYEEGNSTFSQLLTFFVLCAIAGIIYFTMDTDPLPTQNQLYTPPLHEYVKLY